MLRRLVRRAAFAPLASLSLALAASAGASPFTGTALIQGQGPGLLAYRVTGSASDLAGGTSLEFASTLHAIDLTLGSGGEQQVLADATASSFDPLRLESLAFVPLFAPGAIDRARARYGMTEEDRAAPAGDVASDVAIPAGQADRWSSSPTSVPEPATAALLSLGLAAIGVRRRVSGRLVA